jgi:hypothetical protein
MRVADCAQGQPAGLRVQVIAFDLFIAGERNKENGAALAGALGGVCHGLTLLVAAWCLLRELFKRQHSPQAACLSSSKSAFYWSV